MKYLDFTKIKIGEIVYHTILGKGKIINIILPFHNLGLSKILVEFKNKIISFGGKGHDGNNIGDIKGKPGHCWWFYENESEIKVRSKIEEMLEGLEI